MVETKSIRATTPRQHDLRLRGQRQATSDFDYPLDNELIAQRPLQRRDASRLLTVRRSDASFTDGRFRELASLVDGDDVLVLNDTRVFPARLRGEKPTGAQAEILLLDPLDESKTRWRALVRPGGKLKPGRRVVVSNELQVEIEESLEDGSRIIRLLTDLLPEEALARFGRVPLPPYIRRADDEGDRKRYQTVYASENGSVAAPTAGLHFTEALLGEIADRGIGVVKLTLHVGPGTFRPVEAEDPANHRMDAERYRISETAAEAINECRSRRGAVWAVGTTTVRALETSVDTRGFVRSGEGWTRLYIRPGYRFRVVDRLVTNFHLPRSTLLMLVAAFAGSELTMAAYRHAVTRGYRFYSYGDAMAVV